jgi:hypothetical protein
MTTSWRAPRRLTGGGHIGRLTFAFVAGAGSRCRLGETRGDVELGNLVLGHPEVDAEDLARVLA